MKKWIFGAFFFCVLVAISISETQSATIYVVGDSTVQSYAEKASPQTGWGQIIGSFFDASKIAVYNAAIGGRSSKTFIQEGRLNALDGKVKNGDYLFIQFGHNDRYFGSKEREVPFDSLEYWLNQYLEKAKSWGATPVLISPMVMNTYPRNVFSSKYSTRSEYDVRDLMESMAKKNGIPFVDLNYRSYVAYGTELSAAYVSRYLFKYFLAGEYPNYPTGVTNDGTTHFQAAGSLGHAEWIVEELEKSVGAEYLNAASKAAIVKLVSAAKPRYRMTVNANVSGNSGLITHSQELPGGAPLVLHVSPGSFGKKFLHWVDDDCNVLTDDSNFYGQKTLYRNATYTAIFEGGSACVPQSHTVEDSTFYSSSSVEISSSSSLSPSSSASKACSDLRGNVMWKSPIDMVFPEEGNGTTDTNHVGFSGLGFFNIENREGSSAVFKLVSEQSASNAKLMIRYANGSTNARPMKITVDAGTYEVDFPPTASFDSWDSVVVENVWMDALPFDLKMESLTAEGGPNIDMIAFDIVGVYRDGCSTARMEEDDTARLRKNAARQFGSFSPRFRFDALGKIRQPDKAKNVYFTH